MISEEKAHELVSVWGGASSLKDAISKIGRSANDDRTNRRIRREVERMTGIELPAHNPEFSTHTEIECKSNLDIDNAKNHNDFIITSCCNNSEVITPFLESLKLFSDHINGQLLIIPIRYRNPNAVERNEDYQWDSGIYDYALLDDLHVSDSLVISGLRLQATAVNPLSGLHANSGEKSAIYGHPQLAMELVPTPKSELPKMMHTTGSISEPSYSATKAGGKATFHHSVSAVYVKVVGDRFYPIQLSWDGFGFYYLDEYWTKDGYTTDHSSDALVQKDLHAAHADEEITLATERVKRAIKPSTLVWHDIYDHYSQSHHHDLMTKIKIAKDGKSDVFSEVMQCINMIERCGNDYENLIVRSNHHDHLDKWVCDYKPHNDPHNAPFYSRIMNAMINAGKTALECCFRLHANTKLNYKFISPNEPYWIHSIDVSQHGHRGSNGTKGTPRGLARTHHKTIIGDKHSPQIEKGCWVVGVWNTDLDYAQGLSSWMVCDCVIYKNGKRALIFYIDGKSLVDY